MTRISMDIKLTREELLTLAQRAQGEGDDQRAELFLVAAAKYSIGQKVRHVDADDSSYGDAVILDGPKLVGWPEADPQDPRAVKLVYEVADGPVETFEVPEDQLVEVASSV